MVMMNILKRGFNGLASVTFAIPLLVLIATASILGGLIPQGKNVELISDAPEWVREFNVYLQLNDIFHSWWYLLLLVLLGISLLAVTIKRVPVAWRQRGRGVAAGILLIHVGILLILGGVIYGGFSGFRYYTRLIEGEVKVLSSLPFVIKLNRFTVEYYLRDALGKAGTGPRIPKRQESELTLFRSGTAFLQTTTAPGQPVNARGVTLLPSHTDIGWAFSLVVHDPGGREKVIPIRPWAPELIRLGMSTQRIFGHKVTAIGTAQGGAEEVMKPNATEIFLLEESGAPQSLGFASEAAPLSVNGYTVMPWNIRPYTGLHIYRRPGTPLLIAGLTCLMIGLLFTLFHRRSTLVSASAEGDVPQQQQSS